MELVEIVALSHFVDSRTGSVHRKQRVQMDRPTAERLAKLGLVAIQGEKHVHAEAVIEPVPEAANETTEAPTPPIKRGRK